MPAQQFRLRSPIIGIVNDANHHRVTITLPRGTTVEVIDADLTDDRLVDVVWEGSPVKMFAIDLRNRCEVVDFTGA